MHDVTCSVGADLVAIAAVADRCVGSDLDAVRLAMAAANCAAFGVAPLLARADALRPVTRDTVVLADPARRDDTGRRRWRPADLVPPLADLVDAYAGRDLVVKCAPGPGLRGRAVGRGDRDRVAGRRRPGSLPVDRIAGHRWRGGQPSCAMTGHSGRSRRPNPTTARSGRAGEWLVDPDGAVVRAGLVRHYAARHGLGQLDPQDRLPDR